MSEEKFIREIRINPIVPSESVLISSARGSRPRKEEARIERNAQAHVDRCPFCTGNEDKTPPLIAAYPAEGDWAIRVVPNLFPVLGNDGPNTTLSLGLQQIIDGYGHHEVMVDHSNHGISINEMEEAHLCLLLGAYRDRMTYLYESDPRIKYVLIFKNFGPAAGASIPHTHSQVIAMPVVPENVHNETTHTYQHYQKTNHCIFCSLIDEALTFETTIYERDTGEVKRQINVGQYVIERSKKFIAIKPFASRFEWEVHILPLTHHADFTAASEEDLADFAYILKRTMARLDHVIGGAQYNFFLHSQPHGKDYEKMAPSYHWHLEICPRTSIPTGFELGSGLFVSTISPEDAAQQLRDVKL